ncbi:vegetative incompatibility protein het-e-1 [Penicillium malachiteum]|nr:vegetative incompatibility protein het-e-1 [Penicillium malachiteum]
MKKHLKDITSRAKGTLKRFEKQIPREKSSVNEPPDEHSRKDKNDKNQGTASTVCKDASHDKLPTETTSPQSTWGKAYDALKKDDEQLINEYEALFSPELPTEGTHSDNVDIRLTSKTKYKIAGHEFVVQEQIAQAANFIIWAKDLITAATSVSTEASLIWAGVSLILPVLTNHTTAEQANRDGFTHVTARMRFYIALEPRLLSREDNRISQDLRREFEKSILSLYQTILKFQIQSVLRFYKTPVQKTRGDILNPDVWQNMLDEITKIETAMTEDFKKINDTAKQPEVNQEQLQVSQEHRDIAIKLARFVEQSTAALQEIHRDTQPASRDFLAKLPSQPEAAFDSRENEKLKDCHSGTRQDILNTIADWAVDNGSETNGLFWMHGQAGTGKSTISRTMCRLFQESGILGASYFFRRDGGRVNASRLFPTIARQLIDTIPSFASALRESLLNYDRPEIEAKGAMGQCRTLIMEPLENLPKPDRGNVLTRVIIIDALDECSLHDELESIIQSFSTLRLLDSVRLLVFVTGRVISPLVDAFQILDSKGVKSRSLALQTDFREETEKDISMFLKDTFQAIRTKRNVLEDPWPEPDDMEKLVRLATNPSPLFIYASTLCLFVDDGKGRKSPIKQLKAWLSQRKNAS